MADVGNRLNTLANSVFTFDEEVCQPAHANHHHRLRYPQGAAQQEAVEGVSRSTCPSHSQHLTTSPGDFFGEEGWIQHPPETPRSNADQAADDQPVTLHAPTTPNGSLAVDDEATLLRTQLESVKNAAAQLSADLEATKHALQQERQAAAAAKQEALDLQCQLQDTRTSSASKAGEDDATQLRETLTRAKKQLAQYKKQLSETKQASESAAAEVAKLQQELANAGDAHAQLAALKEELANAGDAHALLAALKEELAKRDAHAQAAADQLAASEAHVTHLQEALAQSAQSDHASGDAVAINMMQDLLSWQEHVASTSNLSEHELKVGAAKEELDT